MTSRYWMRLAPASSRSRPRADAGFGDVQARLTALLGCRWVWWVPDARTAWASVLEALGVDASCRVHVPFGIADEVRDPLDRSGATTVEVDLHKENGTPLWPDASSRAGSDRDVFILDHRFGLPSPLPRQHGLVLEDVTAAVGGALGGRPVGSLGTASVLALGSPPFDRSSGALVATDEPSCAGKLVNARAVSESAFERAGAISDDLEALDDWNEGCRAAAGVYDSVWRGLNGAPIDPVLPAAGARPTYSAYLVRVPDPLGLMDALQREGIEAWRPSGSRVERLIGGCEDGRLPGARAFYGSVLRLPNHPDLDFHELLHAAIVVRHFVTVREHMVGTCSISESAAPVNP